MTHDNAEKYSSSQIMKQRFKKKIHNLGVLRTRKNRLLSAVYKLRGQWSKVFKNIFKKDYQKVNIDVENKLNVKLQS